MRHTDMDIKTLFDDFLPIQKKALQCFKGKTC